MFINHHSPYINHILTIYSPYIHHWNPIKNPIYFGLPILIFWWEYWGFMMFMHIFIGISYIVQRLAKCNEIATISNWEHITGICLTLNHTYMYYYIHIYIYTYIYIYINTYIYIYVVIINPSSISLGINAEQPSLAEMSVPGHTAGRRGPGGASELRTSSMSIFILFQKHRKTIGKP